MNDRILFGQVFRDVCDKQSERHDHTRGPDERQASKTHGSPHARTRVDADYAHARTVLGKN